jgi:hypothetical protein
MIYDVTNTTGPKLSDEYSDQCREVGEVLGSVEIEATQVRRISILKQYD